MTNVSWFTHIRQLKSPKERREYLETKLSINLEQIGKHAISEKNNSCENVIGSTQIPVGIAGPLVIQDREYYLPLATTEAALVASVNRGCKAISESKGAVSIASRVGVTRGPVFKVKSLREAGSLVKWVERNLKNLDKIAKTMSSHIELTKIDTSSVGKYVYLRLYFNTEEAMGMNMATIATDKIAKTIEAKTKSSCISIAGNYDIDKKPAWLNFVNGRGFKAWAEVIIPAKVVSETLKTTASKIQEVWLAKCILGSALSGSMGFNAHYANIVAAIFIATGQDPAHVVEGSMGITVARELANGDLYFSVYLPALMVGTVGGGTKLATQKEALDLLKVESSQELAKVVAGAVLAGELSLLASQSAGTLASTHQKLAR